MKKILLCFAAALLAFSCKDNDASAQATSILPGSDRDDHDCIGSAGYTWSEVRQNCIRLWEDGVKLLPVEKPQDGSAILAAYAVFAPDSLQAELFLPAQEKPALLQRHTLPSGGFAWNIEDDDTYNLRKDSTGIWIAEKRGKTLYRASED